MGVIRDNNYFVVHGWMINQMGLGGRELQVYAIIYGFSQEDGQKFKGSLQYLADWMGTSRRNTLRWLQSLEARGLLEKTDIYTNGVKTCEYRCVTDPSRVVKLTPGCCQIDNGGVVKMTPGCCQIDNGGVVKMTPNKEVYKELDKEGDKEGKGVPPTPPAKKKPVKLTAPEIEATLARYAPNPEALELLREWVKVRKAKRAPETEKALTLNLDKLDKLAQESGLSINGYLEAVIARGWAAFYPIREGFGGQARQIDNRSRIKTEAEHAAGQHASGFGW